MARQLQPGPSPTSVLTARGVARGLRQLLPISLFVVPFGLAFGIAATEQGLGALQATVMSVLVFTAVAQFAALEFLTEPVAYVSLGLVVLALSARNIILGATLARWINPLPPGKRLLTLAFLTDANFSVAHSDLQRGETDLGPFLGGGIALWTAWVAGTALGAYGDLIGNAEAFGVSAAMPCFFAATVVGTLRSTSGLMVPVACAIAVSALTYPVLPTGWNIILAALVGGALSLLTNDK
ncbi:MAG: AzlC family ABC transporter permease [Pseudomonadota bacterium]